MKFVKMFLALVGLAVLYVFVRDNTGKVTVEFWDYATPEIELFLILIITFVLGMIAASFGSTLKIMQLKRQLRSAGSADGVNKKEVQKKEKSKDKKRAAAEASKLATAAKVGSTATASSGITDAIQVTEENKEDTGIECHTDASESIDTMGSDFSQKPDTLDAQTVDESAPAAAKREDVGNAAPESVIALPAHDAETEQVDRK